LHFNWFAIELILLERFNALIGRSEQIVSKEVLRMPRRYGLSLIYAIGLVQGLALVTFPAASNIFTSPQGFHFSASRYGMMFIPQVILAILASSLAARMARRWNLKRVLLVGLSANFLAMALLALSRMLQESPGAAYTTLLVATGALGLGFGATVMAANTYAETFSPGRENRAVLILNALLGTGTALAPIFVAIVIALGAWWLLPSAIAVALAGLLMLSAKEPLEASREAARASSSKGLPRRFYLYATAVLLYGIMETLNGNWSGPYLTGDRGVSTQNASFALTTFWAMVTIGRILFAAVSSETKVRWVYVGMPMLLIPAFQVISHASGATSGIVSFGLAGLGCSAFFPLCISLSGKEFPRFAAAMSGEIVAFYQAGYGVAAFGVGPLREFAAVPFRTIYSSASLLAAAMLVVALVVVRAGPQRSAEG
jgi:MFS transporter, FHS family, glucose/mannose:H+ symporter